MSKSPAVPIRHGIVPNAKPGSKRDLSREKLQFLRDNYALPGGPLKCSQHIGITRKSLTAFVHQLRGHGLMERAR